MLVGSLWLRCAVLHHQARGDNKSAPRVPRSTCQSITVQGETPSPACNQAAWGGQVSVNDSNDNRAQVTGLRVIACSCVTPPAPDNSLDGVTAPAQPFDSFGDGELPGKSLGEAAHIAQPDSKGNYRLHGHRVCPVPSGPNCARTTFRSPRRRRGAHPCDTQRIGEPSRSTQAPTTTLTSTLVGAHGIEP